MPHSVPAPAGKPRRAQAAFSRDQLHPVRRAADGERLEDAELRDAGRQLLERGGVKDPPRLRRRPPPASARAARRCHFGNLGVMVDSDTNKIVAPAPLFDHGNSLFNFAGRDALESEESFQEYVDTLLPCVYDDYIAEAKAVLTNRHKAGLRHHSGGPYRVSASA